MVWLCSGDVDGKQMCAVSVNGVRTECSVKFGGFYKKGECYNISASGIEVFKMDVGRDKRSKSLKSLLYNKDVMPPKRSKASDGSVFTKHCASIDQSRYIDHEWRNSDNIIRNKKQLGPTLECIVKLERLSPKVLSKALSRKKEHQRLEKKSMMEMRHRCKAGNFPYFQKSSHRSYITQEETQRIARFQEDGIFYKNNFDNTWGDTKLDSWGNVRFLVKEHGDFSESEEEWHGWWIHIEALQNLPNAQLYCISDGVTESRTVVWDSAVEPMTRTRSKGTQVPE